MELNQPENKKRLENMQERRSSNSTNKKILELSYTQDQMWLLEQLSPHSPTNHITDIVFRINNALDLVAFKQVFNKIIQRHESLRVTIGSDGGRPVQIIQPEFECQYILHDLQSVAADARDKQAAQVAAEEARRPFNLEKGPLFRVVLIQLAPDEYVFIMPMHHIISDGWSAGVIVREFVEGYQALIRGEDIQMRELPLKYSEFIELQKEKLRESNFEKQVAYWKGQLEEPLPVLNIPADYKRPKVMGTEGARVPFVIPADLVKALNEIAGVNGSTLFTLLLTAYWWDYS